MKKLFSLMIATLFLMTIVSAEIVVKEAPKDLYNVGDVLRVPVKIKATSEINEFFLATLICNGVETEIHKEYLTLVAGDEKEITPVLPLIVGFIGRTSGFCKVKMSLGEDYALTNEFKISNLVNIDLKKEATEFNPGEYIIIEGEAIKENEDFVEGFVDVTLSQGNDSIITQASETVHNGYFFFNLSTEDDLKAGEYLISVTVYEKDTHDNVTNRGNSHYDITIKQVPTSLEIISEKSEIEPDTNFLVKAILHDQTGEQIPSTVKITIKDSLDKVLQQSEIATDEFLSYYVPYSEPVSEWTVLADSNELESEATFNITEKAVVDVEVINESVIITNKGNVFYNKTITVRIGNQSIAINPEVSVGESQEYKLEAPNGEYELQIFADDQTQTISGVVLTGKVIDVQKAGSSVMSLIRHPLVWIFILGIIGFFAYMLLKKGYRRNLIGRIGSKKEDVVKPKIEVKVPETYSGLTVNSKNKASLVLSIQGDKQSANVICLKLKNMKELKNAKGVMEGSANEIINKAVHFAESHKATTYENQDNIFFILAPINTRTFRNEGTAIGIAHKIEELFGNYNKLAKQKIDFGLSINYGTIVTKKEGTGIQFMSLGTFITTAKKVAALSTGETLLSEKMNEKVSSEAKTEKVVEDKNVFYRIKELKDKDKYKKFLTGFLQRLDQKN